MRRREWVRWLQVIVSVVVVIALLLTVTIRFSKPIVPPEVQVEVAIEKRLVLQNNSTGTICDDNYCNNHGKCLQLVSNSTDYFCNCSRWYYGEFCNQTCPNLCSGRGDCLLPTANSTSPELHYYQDWQFALASEGNESAIIVNGTEEANSTAMVVGCVCEYPFVGLGCELTCPLNCSNHGTCTLTGVCICDSGYAGSGCELECPNRCSGNGFCVSDPPSHYCICSPDTATPDCAPRVVISQTITVKAGLTPIVITQPPDIDRYEVNSTITYNLIGNWTVVVSDLDLQKAGGYCPGGFRQKLGPISNDLLVQLTITVTETRTPTWSFTVLDVECYNECSECFNGRCCGYGTPCYCDLNPCIDRIIGLPLVIPPGAGQDPRIVEPQLAPIFNSDWKPVLPRANRFPALWQDVSIYKTTALKSSIAVTVIPTFVSVYIIAALVAIAVHLCNRRKQVQGTVTVKYLSHRHPCLRILIGDHLVLGALFVDPLDRYTPVHRLTVCCAQILSSLTLSALWCGTQSSLGNYIATSFVSGLVMVPLEMILLLLFRRPPFQSHEEKLNYVPDAQDWVAFATALLLIAWCSYVSILFGYEFGPARSAYWLRTFAISVALQLTLYHSARTLAKFVLLMMARPNSPTSEQTNVLEFPEPKSF